VVDRSGRDTLAYFALRDDKEWFFSGDSMVAYAVFGSVCLVSPDPVGPPAERDEVWRQFGDFADRQGWSVTVLGASEEWLPVYQRHGLHSLYIGDEAIVDCTSFTLEGHRSKGLRQAVNRVARHGYRVEFFDPAAVDPALQSPLMALLVASRHGDAERGFSMTLGRLFDPADKGLLLAVAFGPDGPAAFCQFVPAPGIDGYSLDVMRRSLGDHPNGLTDFVLVETIRHLKESGFRRLGLNFATMRAVLAGETGDGTGPRMQRWLLGRMSESLQIESLWRFNEKYDPDWRARYAAFDAPDHVVAAALAVARAEGVTELPVVGRFFRPPGRLLRPG
jgi:lysyl-tRNA synthetase class 2